MRAPTLPPANLGVSNIIVGEGGEKTRLQPPEEMGSDAGASSPAIEHRAYARVGLLGNPSDVYHGRTISFSLGNFWASVRLQPSEDLVFLPHPTHDLVQFTSLDHLVWLSRCFSSLSFFVFFLLVLFRKINFGLLFGE